MSESQAQNLRLEAGGIMGERFVSEPIRPLFEIPSEDPGATADHTAAIGEPILPTRFVWREREYAMGELLEAWKELSPCHSGSGERYVRKHWYRIRTTDGIEMKIYFERQARSKGSARRRWWLFSWADNQPDPPAVSPQR